MASTSGIKETDEPASSSSVKDLIDHVFSWSIQDILNDDLYKHKVEKIPKCFESVEHYLGSYTMPLQEKTLMEICSQMEFLSGVPHAEVISIDSWRNRYGIYVKEPYSLKPSDLFILGDTVPEDASDLQRFGSSWSLDSIVKDVKESNHVGDEDRLVYFQVRTSKPIKTVMREGTRKSPFVVFMMNLTTNTRTWKALHMSRNLNIIKELLFDRIWAGEVDSQILPALSESQRAAVSGSISAVQCNHRSSKNQTISILLYSLLSMNYRTLSYAPKNITVAELALRILNLHKDACESDSGKDKSGCSLGNFILLGNMNRLELCDDIGKIYVDYRLDSLVEFFAPLTGWKKHFDSMVDFLEDCVVKYRLPLETEIVAEVHVAEKIGTNSEVHMSLLKFAKDRFRGLAVPLKRSVRILCTHLPKRLLLPDNFEKMVSLCGLLESFEIFLSQSHVAEKEIEELLARQKNYSKEVQVSRAFSCISTTLHKMRIECVQVLRSVGHSIEFCLKNSSLIFSTLSSSYNLHEVDLEPLDLLVIDEASQLKECESVIPYSLKLYDMLYRMKLTLEEVYFERLGFFGHSEDLHNMQYRMHPEISSFQNRKFYKNQIKDVQSVLREDFQKNYLPGPMFGPYSFINISNGREETWEGSKRSLTIGIISPYAAQIAAIENKVVMSANGFNGGEEDVIIISTVGSDHNGGSDGFLSNPQLTNVALTRVRHFLWILGNDKKLSKGGSFWEDLIRDAKQRQCFFNVDEDEELVKEMIKSNKEHDQLDNLLKKESMLVKSALWKVLFNNNFRKSFGKLKSSQTQKSVVNILVTLSKGWRPKKLKVKTFMW
ncbi:hypothetical protein MKX01_000869 [Papaver californicum]|nr:hypothetical protein MKX01_000869 [Papaver californicum]